MSNTQTGNSASDLANANWLDKVNWDANGLVPVIAQEATTGDVLMFAWMNREALAKTVEVRGRRPSR